MKAENETIILTRSNNTFFISFYFKYVQRRERRDVDDVVVWVGSRQHNEKNVGSRREETTTTVSFLFQLRPAPTTTTTTTTTTPWSGRF